VNEHVDGLARELRALGHDVTVLAPSTRASDLVAGRRALLDGVEADVIALGPALPVSRRSRIGVPVGVRANLALALERGRFDVVHGFEPGLPSLSYLALTFSHALSVATFLSVERLNYPRSLRLLRNGFRATTAWSSPVSTRRCFGRLRSGGGSSWSGGPPSAPSLVRCSERSGSCPTGSSCSCEPSR
jgi:hypothetical protein